MSEAPHTLQSLQTWFASLMTPPLRDNEKLEVSLQQEACRHIAQYKGVTPLERIEIYHQQYWWRLLKTLAENYPLLAHLLGPEEFRVLSIAYLTTPPSHYLLAHLGENLPAWLEKTPWSRWKEAALLDRAAQELFYAQKGPILDFSSFTPDQPLTLQPTVKLFFLEENLFEIRDALARKTPKPPLTKKIGYYVLYQNAQEELMWKEQSRAEYLLLQAFKEGRTIAQACALLEKEYPEWLEEAEIFMPLWFKEWSGLPFFIASIF